MSKRPLGFHVDRPTITIKGPFQSHANMDAVWARATVELQGSKRRVAVLISGPSEVGIIGTGSDGRPTDEEREEARVRFAIVELTRRPLKNFEPPKPGFLAEIRVEIGRGPDSGIIGSGPAYEGMWTIASIRTHPSLRGYDVGREGSAWIARPKAS